MFNPSLVHRPPGCFHTFAVTHTVATADSQAISHPCKHLRGVNPRGRHVLEHSTGLLETTGCLDLFLRRQPGGPPHSPPVATTLGPVWEPRTSRDKNRDRSRVTAPPLCPLSATLSIHGRDSSSERLRYPPLCVGGETEAAARHVRMGTTSSVFNTTVCPQRGRTGLQTL